MSAKLLRETTLDVILRLSYRKRDGPLERYSDRKREYLANVILHRANAFVAWERSTGHVWRTFPTRTLNSRHAVST